MKSLKNEKGFTIVEALIAILVLSIGVLVVGTMQFTSIKTNASANARSEAHAVALSILELLQQIPYDEDILDTNQTHAVQELFADDGTSLYRQIPMAYSLTSDQNYPLDVGTGRHFNTTWDVTDQNLANQGQTKVITLSVSWVTQNGTGSSSIITVKYRNVDIRFDS